MTDEAPPAFQGDGVFSHRWDLHPSPTRPSAAEVDFYRSQMQNVDEVLLLGATPEIRTVGRELGMALTAVDRSPSVYRSLESLVSGDGSRENFCESDWVNMNLGRRFDLVIGDGAINMVPPELQEPLIRNLAEHVEVGGRLLLRTSLAVPPHVETIEQAIEAGRRRGGPFYSSIKLPLSQMWRDPVTGGISGQMFKERMVEVHAQGLISDDEWDEFLLTIEEARLVVYYVAPERFEEMTGPWFEVNEVVAVGGYPGTEQKPIHVLSRR